MPQYIYTSPPPPRATYPCSSVKCPRFAEDRQASHNSLLHTWLLLTAFLEDDLVDVGLAFLPTAPYFPVLMEVNVQLLQRVIHVFIFNIRRKATFKNISSKQFWIL